MPIEDIEADFPNLRMAPWAITSPIADVPNCLGWALHDRNQFWDPSMVGVRGYYWPPGVPREWTLNSIRRVFQIHGYGECESADLETGFEKIAIYVDVQDEPTHIAVQKDSGVWSSKLGVYEDIEHPTLESLESAAYGSVSVKMKRKRT